MSLCAHATAQADVNEISDPAGEGEARQKAFKSFQSKITLDNHITIRDKIIAVGIKSPVTLRGLIDQACTHHLSLVRTWKLPGLMMT